MPEGLTMGGLLIAVLSDIYMHYFRVKLFKLINSLFQKRYIDNSFALLDLSKYTMKDRLDILNSINPCIPFYL